MPGGQVVNERTHARYLALWLSMYAESQHFYGISSFNGHFRLQCEPNLMWTPNEMKFYRPLYLMQFFNGSCQAASAQQAFRIWHLSLALCPPVPSPTHVWRLERCVLIFWWFFLIDTCGSTSCGPHYYYLKVNMMSTCESDVYVHTSIGRADINETNYSISIYTSPNATKSCVEWNLPARIGTSAYFCAKTCNVKSDVIYWLAVWDVGTFGNFHFILLTVHVPADLVRMRHSRPLYGWVHSRPHQWQSKSLLTFVPATQWMWIGYTL